MTLKKFLNSLLLSDGHQTDFADVRGFFAEMGLVKPPFKEGELSSDEPQSPLHQFDAPNGNFQKRITEEQARACYEQFLHVHYGEKTIEEAIEKPVRLGMNVNSAKRYIAATLKGLLSGTTYKSSVNLRDQALFLSLIERDFGQEGLIRALRAYKGHIDYLENEIGVAHPRRRAQLAEFSKRLT